MRYFFKVSQLLFEFFNIIFDDLNEHLFRKNPLSQIINSFFLFHDEYLLVEYIGKMKAKSLV